MPKKIIMKKNRCFEFIFYNKDDVVSTESLCNLNNFQYAYILHDKDVYDNDVFNKETGELIGQKGQLKKPHYHFVVYFENARYLDSVSKVFDVPLNMIEIKSSLKGSIEYLIHKNHKDKFQYSRDEVVGNLKSYLDDKTSERDDLIKIFSFIDDNQIIYYYNLVQFCLKENVWSSFRRNCTIINRYLDEHNLKFNYKK